MRVDAQAKFEATLEQMTISKEKHEALVRKYMRDIDIATTEARRIYTLTKGEPSTNTRSHVLSILRRRAILQRSVDSLRDRIASLFQHELSLEQGMLLADHISTVKRVRDTLFAIAPDPDAAHDLIDTVNTMTDRVCEVSELLAEPQLCPNIDEGELEREFMELLESSEPPPLIPEAPPLVPSLPPEVPVAPSTPLPPVLAVSVSPG